MMRGGRRAASGLCALAALIAVSAPPALADSLVYIKDANVWLANPDGSGQYQVTLDGTASAPYETPSQANDGTIAAIRQSPGQRRQIYRMTQSGALLNDPINTPAPGTGARDAKVSPDGRLVAYWFVTTVGDPLCPFCVNVANQALISYSDRFTNYDAVGTPNMGGWPSWLGNDTVVLGNGSATEWYYRIGMPEAAPWFADSDFVSQGFQTLLDAEAAPTGDRVAVVRGNHQEEILVLRMTGAPPAKPTIADPQCAELLQPTGSFVDPTWSSDGRLLAWQEGNGVWSGAIPADLANCAGFGPFALRIPGAANPDLGPAAINPGPRPSCGSPGNPTPCKPSDPQPCASCPQVDSAAIRRALGDFAKRVSRRIADLTIRGLLRKGRVTVAFTAPSPGTLAARLTFGRRARALASGRRTYMAAGKAKLTIKLTGKGKKRLRAARRLTATMRVSFTPSGAPAISATSRIRLKR